MDNGCFDLRQPSGCSDFGKNRHDFSGRVFQRPSPVELPYSSSLQRRPLASPVQAAPVFGKGENIILPSINAGSSFWPIIRSVRNEGIKTDRPAEQFNKFGMALVAYIAAVAGHEPHPPGPVDEVKKFKAIALRAAFVSDKLRHGKSKERL